MPRAAPSKRSRSLVDAYSLSLSGAPRGDNTILPKAWPALDEPVRVYRPQTTSIFYYENPGPLRVKIPPCSASSPSSPASSDTSERIRRPRNAFMIFRSKFLEEKRVSERVEHDHRHISRIIAHCWHSLSEEDRDEWHRKAEQEKALHKMKYPDYRFTPTNKKRNPAKRKTKRNGEKELSRCKLVADLICQGKSGKDLEEAMQTMEMEAHSSDSGPATPSSSAPSPGYDSEVDSTPLSPSSDIYLPESNGPKEPIFRSPLIGPTEPQPSETISQPQLLPTLLSPTIMQPMLLLPPADLTCPELNMMQYINVDMWRESCGADEMYQPCTQAPASQSPRDNWYQPISSLGYANSDGIGPYVVPSQYNYSPYAAHVDFY